MGDASSGSLILVPKGGKVINGIGETFAPDLHTGTGNVTVPLAVPPGRSFRAAIEPHLQTGNRSGLFGVLL